MGVSRRGKKLCGETHLVDGILKLGQSVSHDYQAGLEFGVLLNLQERQGEN